MRLLFVMVTLSGVACESRADADSLADVFPLAIGNRWAYQYYTLIHDFVGWDDRFTTDTGSVVLLVTGRQMFADSTRWSLYQIRNLQRAINTWPNIWQYSTIQDSIIITLTESHQGWHRLTIGDSISRVMLWVFPFGLDLTDTTSIYRYREVDTNGFSRFGIYSGSFPRRVYDFTFRAGLGMERVSSSYIIVGGNSISDHMLRAATLTSIENERMIQLPNQPILKQNYPNPFNPVTNIQFTIGNPQLTILKVYDLLGREVATLVNEVKEPGTHMVTWDASGFSSGVYFYRLSAGGFVESKKLVLLR